MFGFVFFAMPPATGRVCPLMEEQDAPLSAHGADPATGGDQRHVRGSDTGSANNNSAD